MGQVQSSATRTHQIPTLVALIVAIVAATMALLPQSALADYTPPAGPYAFVVGPNGTNILNDSTPLSPSDSSSFWNSSTGFSRVLVPVSGVNCGYWDGCIIFDNAGTSLLGVPGCTVPTPPSGWAATYIDTDSQSNLGAYPCHGIGSDYAPTFVVSYVSAPSSGYTHIQRHEVGHALGLNDTSSSCYYDSGYKPLMNNGTYGTCGIYPSNTTATYNEIQAVISRNSWY